MTISLFLSLWAPVGVWAALIYYLSSIPSLNSGFGVWDLILRKCAHVFEFAVLCSLMLRAMGRTWSGWSRSRLLIWAGTLALLYAMSDEYHQSFVPGRGPSVHDVLIDGVGVGLALYIYRRHCEREA